MTSCLEPGCTRRQLLAGAGALAGLAVVGGPRLAFGAGGGDLLVVVTLAGGADGLSLVPPIGDPGYLAARPSIAVRSGQAVRLDRTFGLHPGLRPLLPWWASRRLAVVHAVGDADGTRSHFEATDALQRGVDVGSHESTGWVDRLIVARGARSGGLPALAIGGRTPGYLVGPSPELVARDVTELRLQQADAGAQRALRDMYVGLPGAFAASAEETLDALGRFARLRGAPYTPRDGAAYPASPLGRSLRQVAQVARAGLGLEVACVEGGGWDTHEGMGGAAAGRMHDQVLDLGQALAAFATDLGPLLAGTTVVTLSEFGRRVAQNGSGGVDHGHGSAMLVLGGGVVGGRVYGRWPGLAPSQLDDGDLRVTTDYRDVLGELVTRRLGTPRVENVFPRHHPRPLGLVRQR